MSKGSFRDKKDIAGFLFLLETACAGQSQNVRTYTKSFLKEIVPSNSANIYRTILYTSTGSRGIK